MQAVAVAIGLAAALIFAALDAFVDVRFLGDPLLENLTAPVELWARFAAAGFSVVAALSYARLLLSREEVAAASQLYRALAESARDEIFVYRRDTGVVYLNTHAASHYGKPPEELVGTQVDELFLLPDVENARADLDRAFGGAETYVERELNFDGKSKWMSTRLVPMRGPDGAVESVLGIARDITGMRREIALGNALNRISEIVHAGLSIDEILQSVSIEMAEAAGVETSVILACDEEAWTIRFVRGYPEDVVGSQFSTDEAMASELAVATRSAVSIDDAAHDDRVNPAIIERFGIRSMLVVPLLSRRGVGGVLLLIHRSKQIGFPREVVEFGSRVATSVSLAMDNARLYEEQRNVAETLQAAILMLPKSLPGVEFAHVYHSATEVARVGGDFYDLFELRGGKVGITIGDIAGHGIDAAVLTSLVKNGIQVEATQEGRPPDEVVARASRLLFENSSPEVFATVFFGVLDLSNGRLAYCNAGHTTGCIRGVNGNGVKLLQANSPLAGAFPEARFALSSEMVGLGDLLFLYTDGLTEARGDGGMFGEERLLDLVTKMPDIRASAALDHVLTEATSFAGDTLRDDLAILSLRRV